MRAGSGALVGAAAGVSRLLERRWLTRSWIRQEIGVACKETTVHVCGSETVRWETFEKAGWPLYSNRFRRTEPLSKEESKELAAGDGLLVDVSNGGRPGVTLGHALSLRRIVQSGSGWFSEPGTLRSCGSLPEDTTCHWRHAFGH